MTRGGDWRLCIILYTKQKEALLLLFFILFFILHISHSSQLQTSQPTGSHRQQHSVTFNHCIISPSSKIIDNMKSPLEKLIGI